MVTERARESAFGGRWPGKEQLVRRTPTLAERETFRTALQKQYEARVANLGKSVADGTISVRQWQNAMNTATAQYLIRQQVLGAGTTRIDAETLTRLNAEVRRQQAFISRFADQIGARVAVDRPMSAAQVSSRARSYSGAGRAFGARAQERSTPGERWQYIAVDDDGTCDPCMDAEGIYDGDSGPYPGEICEGRGNCRCTRELVA